MSFNHAKVSYLTLDGYESTAYVVLSATEDIGVGTDKHTDKPVSVQWIDRSEHHGFYEEIDTGIEYEFDAYDGVWVELPKDSAPIK
jgi:hypothetical protein